MALAAEIAGCADERQKRWVLPKVVQKHPSIYNQTLYSSSFPAFPPVSELDAAPVLIFVTRVDVQVTRVRYSPPEYFAFS